MTSHENSPMQLPSRFKRIIGSELFRNSVLVLSLSVAIISFLSATLQTRRAQSLEYMLKSSHEAPILAPTASPRIVALGAELTTHNRDNEAIVTISRLSTEVTLINKSNTPAALDAWGSLDAYTRDAIIRARYLGEHADIPLEASIEDIFQEGNRQTANGETITIPFDTDLRGLKGNSFIVHYIFIYRNPAGLIYDTYYWTQYRVEPSSCSAACSETEPLFRITNPQEHKHACLLLKIEHASFESHVYSESDTERLNRLGESVTAAKRHGFEIWHTLTKPFMPDEELTGANNS
jgi:hypothetical protein